MKGEYVPLSVCDGILPTAVIMILALLKKLIEDLFKAWQEACRGRGLQKVKKQATLIDLTVIETSFSVS